MSFGGGGGAVSAGGLTGDIQPIWNTSNAIGTETFGGGGTGIWNASNPIGTDTLNASTVSDTGPGWWARNIGSIDEKQLAGALGGLGKAASGGGGGGGGGGQTQAHAGQAQSRSGAGGSNLFDQVVQQMLKRQQLYAANTNPLGANLSPEQSRARGMLGI